MADKPISFATFNLQNFARAGQVTYPGETVSPAQEAAKIRWTADRLREMNADVVGFQEVWSAGMVADACRQAGLDYEFVARDGPPEHVQVALGVRRGLLRPGGGWTEAFPPEMVLKKRPAASGPPEPIEVAIHNFSRPVLMAMVEPGILVAVAHLKSKRPTPLDAAEAGNPAIKKHAEALGKTLSAIRRTAEAAALRIMLAKKLVGEGLPAVVMGDLNDNERAVSTGIITGEPRYVLSASGGAGAAADIALYSTADLQKFRSLKDVIYTYLYNDQAEVIDHILVSEEFYDASRRRRWSFAGLKVWNDHQNGRVAGSSDHGPAVARFVPLPTTNPLDD